MKRLLLIALLFGFSLAANASLKGLVEAMAASTQNSVVAAVQRGPSDTEDADELFLLGWLSEGRFGVPADKERAQEYLQRAAEKGSIAAMEHCWQRCLTINDAVSQHLQSAAQNDDPQALYLLYRQARGRDEDVAQVDEFLLRAAKARNPNALGELYAHHFVDWAGQRRTFAEAEEKLRRCRLNGLVYCYYLSGALYQRRGDSDQALLYYQMLRWLDADLFDRYLSDDDLEGLRQRLPQQNAEPVLSRAAVQLSSQPLANNPRIDRFRHCAKQRGHECVARLAQRDEHCLPMSWNSELFETFRDSPGYRACLAISQSAE